MDEFRYDYRPTRRRMRDSRRTYGTYDDRNYGTRNYRGRFSQHYNENDYRTQPEDTAFPVEKFRKILIDGVPEAKEMDETEQIKCLEKIDEANQLYRDIVLSNLCICASKSKRMSIEPLPKNTKGIHLPHLEIPLHQKFLYEYKISKCPEKNCVDPECFGYHSEEDRRRKPFFLDEGTFFYYPIICPHSKTCDKETCRFAHNQLEIDFHPLTYKTVICKYDSKDQISCLKRNQFCADAHGINDLRNLKEIFSKLNTSIIMSNATKVPLTAPPDLNLISPPIPRKHHLVSPSKKPIEFSLETYKTEKCSQSVCDIPLCLNYHSILERRRTALLSPRECPKVFIDGQFKEPSLCPDGDECPFCHTFNEFVYHFCNYKTKVCVRAPCELGVACPDIHAEEVQGLGPRAPQEEVKEISNYKLKYKKLKQKVEKLKSQCGKFKCNSCYNSFKEKYIYYSSCRHQLCETCRIPEKCKICDSATPSIEIYLQ